MKCPFSAHIVLFFACGGDPECMWPLFLNASYVPGADHRHCEEARKDFVLSQTFRMKNVLTFS